MLTQLADQRYRIGRNLFLVGPEGFLMLRLTRTTMVGRGHDIGTHACIPDKFGDRIYPSYKREKVTTTQC